MTTDPDATVGVVLAGGLARRMGGGDKPMRRIGGRTILERVLERLRPQCGRLAINANGDPSRFSRHGLPVIGDGVPDNPGPLAGVLAGLDWAAGLGAGWVVSVAGDCPFLPADLVRRFHAARIAEGAELCVAESAGRTHPVIGLWSVERRDDLRRALVEEGMRKIDRWTARFPLAVASWPADPVDPFFNANTLEDLAEAERLAALVHNRDGASTGG